MKIAHTRLQMFWQSCFVGVLTVGLLWPLRVLAEEATPNETVTSPSQEEAPEPAIEPAGTAPDGQDALIAAAVTIWGAIILFMGIQFWRQRQLSLDLKRMERSFEKTREQKEQERDVRFRTNK